jgi:type VI secretion system protein ImpM
VTADKKARPVGFHGKAAVIGDFITRHLDRPLVERWESWVQEALACSREQLGADWLDCYLTCPVWRFALSPGVLGSAGIAGLFMPSVDRVGRYYPFAVFATVTPGTSPVGLTLVAGDWYARAEALMLTALQDDFDVDAFDGALGDLNAPAAMPDGSTPGRLDLEAGAGPGVRLAADAMAGIASAYRGILEDVFGANRRIYGLWWTSGSDRVASSLLVTEGLPRFASFAALLDGDWQRLVNSGDAPAPRDDLPSLNSLLGSAP